MMKFSDWKPGVNICDAVIRDILKEKVFILDHPVIFSKFECSRVGLNTLNLDFRNNKNSIQIQYCFSILF